MKSALRKYLLPLHRWTGLTVGLDELIRWCDLTELLDRDASQLSGGQRQRLLLALGLVVVAWDPRALDGDVPARPARTPAPGRWPASNRPGHPGPARPPP